MQKVMMGMWDRAAEHGEVTGSGPGFAEAQRKFKERQAKIKEVGKYRKSDNPEQGTFIDPDWYVVDWGQRENE